MTTTPHGQVPAIQRYKLGYHSDECGVRSSTPSGIPDASGSWVRYADHAAEFRRLHAYCQELEAHVILDCMTHAQSPSEIEHVAGDVSKNGAELNMTQQTAPATPQDPAGWYVTGCSRLLDEDDAKAEARHIGGTARAIPLYTAPQPSPTAQAADNLPALDRDRIREIFMAHGFAVKEGQTDLKQYVYDAAEALLCAARTPADSVLEDAKRYRWLRRWKGQEHEPPFTVQHEIDGTLWGGDLDAAIDAARKQGGA